MTHMTSEEYLALQLRRQISQESVDHGMPYLLDTDAEDAPESKLVSDIVAFCKKQGWPCLSFPQTKAVRKFLRPGWWDITIKIPKGVTLDIETKKVKTGRLSPEQKLLKNMCAQLGHKIHKVDKWDQFMELIANNC